MYRMKGVYEAPKATRQGQTRLTSLAMYLLYRHLFSAVNRSRRYREWRTATSRFRSRRYIVAPSGSIFAASPSPVRIRSSLVEKISVNKNAANDASVQ